ncbi:MAG: N-acetylglucosamine kinase [Flavobacteriaceae bacterium]|nr:N-acetylglucosamine kinase [Flavobacteriaceae bacterium]
MILITDSGSTKCDWIALDEQGEQVFRTRTMGLNPATLSSEELILRITGNEELCKHKDNITKVFFYGAGCGTQKPRQNLHKILSDFFSDAAILVKEDTAAAVYACIDDHSPGVVCIMGTGSNCCFYDGKNIEQRVTSLGYILMDEASGNWFGKELIRGYYFNIMPEYLRISFASQFNLEADEIKRNLYKEPNPNAYLASFATFIFQNLEEVYIQKVIRKGLRRFAKHMILQFKDEIQRYPVHFAGSIAYFSKDQLSIIAEEFGFKVGNIVRRPIEGLVEYHKQTLV